MTTKQDKCSNFKLKVWIGLLVMLMNYGIAVATVNPSEDYKTSSIEQHDFNEANWESAKVGIDYSGELVEEAPKKEENQKNRIQFDSGFKKNLAQLLLFLLLIGLVVTLLWFVLGAGRFVENKTLSKHEKLAVSVDEIEQNLERHDPTDLITQAVNSEDYRLAVRLYYLKIIRQLSLNGHIVWERRKTNKTYLKELQEAKLKMPFQTATRIFDRVWYGNRTIQQIDFQELEPQFKALLNAISKREE